MMFYLDQFQKRHLFYFLHISKQRLRVQFLIVLLPFSPALVAEITEQKKLELELLRKSISQLQDNLITNNEEKMYLEIDFKDIEIKIKKNDQNIRNLNSKIALTEGLISEKEIEQNTIEKELSQQSQIMIQQLRSAHQLGYQEPVKLLLNQEDPATLARMVKYYDYFLRARSTKIVEYSKNIDDLSSLIKEIKGDKLKLVNNKKKLEIERQKANIYVEERSGLLRRLSNDIAEDKIRLANLRRQQSGLEALIDAVGTVASSLEISGEQRPFQSFKGKLEWPTKGKLLKRFGSKRSGSIPWNGWLIKAKKGNSVKAIHEGRIVFSDYLRGFGLMLILDHGDGFMTLYGHNQELLRDTGDWAKSNDEIAKAGNTGGLAESALYFEIRHEGRPQNPKTWLIGN